MKITLEQFLRGCAAIQTYDGLVSTVRAALTAAGSQSLDDLGGDFVATELRRQLEERCGDVDDPLCGTMVGYMLHEAPTLRSMNGRGGWVRDLDGREFVINTPEDLWAYWEATASGPFAVAP